jgi:ABC-type phosphate transport system substrate-binding protein
MSQHRIPAKTKIYPVGLFLGAALVLASGFAAVAADYVVIANKGVSASSLGKSDAQAIFLGDKSKWDDGKPIKIAVLEAGSAHKAFLQHVVGKSPSQFDSYWKKLMFSGKAAAPKSFSDDQSLVEFVAGHAGAVGYVAAGSAGGSVKTISIK